MAGKADISIITACMNAQSTIDDSICSVSRQTIPVQRIYIDGESSDETLPIIKSHLDENDIVISEPDDGFYDAINKGIRRVSGDIVGILNADDYYADNRVLESVQDVFNDDRIDVCYGDLDYVDMQGNVTRHWRSGEYRSNSFFWGWMPPHPTFFVRRAVYETYGVFNTGLGSAADYELMLRLLVKNKLKAAYIPRVMVKMRTGGMSNRSLYARLQANRMDRKAWEVNHLTPYPWTIPLKPLRKLGQWLV